MCALLLLSVFTGCSEISLGPRTERQLITIRPYDAKGRPVVLGTVAKNVKVPVKYETEDGQTFTQDLDIGGYDVSPPPLPKVPAPAPNAADAAVLDQYLKDWRDGKK